MSSLQKSSKSLRLDIDCKTLEHSRFWKNLNVEVNDRCEPNHCALWQLKHGIEFLAFI